MKGALLFVAVLVGGIAIEGIGKWLAGVDTTLEPILSVKRLGVFMISVSGALWLGYWWWLFGLISFHDQPPPR